MNSQKIEIDKREEWETNTSGSIGNVTNDSTLWWIYLLRIIFKKEYDRDWWRARKLALLSLSID